MADDHLLVCKTSKNCFIASLLTKEKRAGAISTKRKPLAITAPETGNWSVRNRAVELYGIHGDGVYRETLFRLVRITCWHGIHSKSKQRFLLKRNTGASSTTSGCHSTCNIMRTTNLLLLRSYRQVHYVSWMCVMPRQDTVIHSEVFFLAWCIASISTTLNQFNLPGGTRKLTKPPWLIWLRFLFPWKFGELLHIWNAVFATMNFFVVRVY